MAERKHVLNLVFSMAIGGILGGMGNYLMIPEEANASLLRSLLLGIVAAGVLPLFLKMISSNLIDHDNSPGRFKKYLTVAAFSILTGVFADVFLRGIYGKVFHVLEDKIEEQDNEIARVGFINDVLLDAVKDPKKPPSSPQYLDYIKDNYQLNNEQLKLYSEILSAPVQSYTGSDLTPEKQAQIKALADKNLIRTKELNNEFLISGMPMELNTINNEQ
ncbi:hypothetical protein SAMN04490243_2678 [Robiginitalea myxolifaciens]|uniref:YEATS-Like-Associating Three TM domain-containing protein n=1 Tax=Robiginitalea myxolifaciens TaxID=400055 RepID=A0A1I6HFN0_9FLAO|nr:YEATS-associated helix-containing protein [Robiginitalea myxolifaciens]SFR53150.1 hypothetical protein SAMN04490243_2678 [Robiginitalea myxolifaciens]